MPRSPLIRVLCCALLGLAAGCSAPTSEELLAEAKAALAAGETRTAEIHLRNLLQQHPDDRVGRALLGEVLLSTGDVATAEHNLRRAVELGTPAADVHIDLLRALLAQRKFAAVLDELESGPTLTGPAGIAALSISGAAYRGLRRYAEAEAAYRTVVESDPRSPNARVDLGQVLFEAGRLAEARGLAMQVTAEHPDFVPALLLLGALEVAAGEVAAGEQRYAEALRIEAARGRGPGYVFALAPLIEAQLAQRNIDAAATNVDELLAAAPQSPVGRYLKARVEVEQGELDAAERRLEPLVVEFADYWPAHALLGVINARQGQLGQAEMYLRTALNNAPENATARLLLADVYLQRNNLVAARELLAERPDTAGGVAAALAARASIAAGDADLAAEYFERSEQNGPRTLRDVIELSSVYAASGELERAARVLGSVEPDTPESAQLVASLLTVIRAQRGEFDAAAATADQLVRDLPGAAWPLTLRANVALLSGNVTAAQDFYAAALQREARHVPALLGLARTAAAQGKLTEAATHLRSVIDIDATQMSAILGMAQLAVARGDFAEAETWLLSAPESPVRMQLLGDLFFRQRRFDAAADAFDRAFELAPSGALAVRRYFAAREAGRQNPEAGLAAWHREHPADVQTGFTLGTHALERGDHAGAVGYYEGVLAVNPRHPAALNNLAWLYDQRGDDRALDLAKRAREVMPRDPSVADTLGWLYVQRGQSALGLPLLQEAVRARPDHLEIRYHYAVALADTGEVGSAADLLTELLDQPAEFPDRAAAAERLASLRQAGSQ